MRSQPDTPTRTRAPAGGRPVVLYDGECAFCSRQAATLQQRARGGLDTQSFQDEGILACYPGLTHEACMREMKLVDRAGRVFGGAEAVVRSMAMGRGPLATLALGYYLPIIRPIANWVYKWIASRRYRFGADCETGRCQRHSS